SGTTIVGVASVISWGVGLLVLIAFFVVIVTVVRRHRPDATPILLGAISFECLISLAAYATQIALPRFLSVSGPSGGGYMEAYALSNVIFSVAHAAARGFLLWGIVRLAEPLNR
ncbi:MAG TPA: hypothetical protein VHM25_08335, partial [Polyangiaceae bacterium]|nr:hypothetical protein [Polyangiaceae bacterium]